MFHQMFSKFDCATSLGDAVVCKLELDKADGKWGLSVYISEYLFDDELLGNDTVFLNNLVVELTKLGMMDSASLMYHVDGQCEDILFFTVSDEFAAGFCHISACTQTK